MGKKGRKSTAGIARAKAPNLALRALRSTRKSAGNRVPIHFRHVTFKRDGKAVATMRRRQAYIERDGAAETLDLPEVKAKGLAATATRFIDEQAAETATRASFGTLGSTAEERRAFWSQVDALEGPRGRVQYGIIAELPHEVSPAGRLRIAQLFCEKTLEARHLPYWAVTHKPDAHNDARNYHTHILYYARPGTRTGKGWIFGGEPATSAGAATPTPDGKPFPWGTERPGERVRRLTRKLKTAEDAEKRQALQAQLDQAQEVARDAAQRRTSARGGPQNKDRDTYPWGQEAPGSRRSRIQKQIDAKPDHRRRPLWDASIREIDDYFATDKKDQAGPAKPPAVHDKRWFESIRATWCDACNEVLAEENFPKRYHPKGYKDLGIDAEPTKHLGTKAAALEAQGFMTGAGRENTEKALRSLLSAGIDLDEAVTEAARQILSRRQSWAEMEADAARKAGLPDRVEHWTVEAETARKLRSAIDERLAAPEPEPARQIFGDRIREVLRFRSALPDPPETGLATIPVVNAPDMSRLAASLLARMPSDVLARAKEAEREAAHADAEARAEEAARAAVAAETRQPAAITLPTPAAEPGTALLPIAPSEQPAGTQPARPNALARQATLDRIAKAELRLLTEDRTRRAFRVRPDASNEERTAIRTALLAKSIPDLRRHGRHTWAALEHPRSPDDQAALEAGLETVGEALQIALSRKHTPVVMNRIGIQGVVRNLRTAGERVITAAEELGKTLPRIRQRIAELATSRRTTEQDIAIDAIPVYKQALAKSLEAAEAARHLAHAVQHLDDVSAASVKEARLYGGHGAEQRTALARLQHRVSTAVAWVPPVEEGRGALSWYTSRALGATRLPPSAAVMAAIQPLQDTESTYEREHRLSYQYTPDAVDAGGRTNAD